MKVRLTEAQLHRVIKEATRKVLREFDSDNQSDGQFDPRNKSSFDGYIASLKASRHAYVPEEELQEFGRYCESMGITFNGGAQDVPCRVIYND